MTETQPTQKHAPYPDETVARIEQVARDAVTDWFGGVKTGRIERACAAAETYEAGVDVSVTYEGYLRGPFTPYVDEHGMATLQMIHDDGSVTVRVVIERG